MAGVFCIQPITVARLAWGWLTGCCGVSRERKDLAFVQFILGDQAGQGGVLVGRAKRARTGDHLALAGRHAGQGHPP